MRNVNLLKSGLILAAAIFTFSANAALTGNLSDWNVTPGGASFTGTGTSFANWHPAGASGNGHSALAADSGFVNGINYTVWDGFGPHGFDGAGGNKNLKDFGGQNFDVKAMYAKSDGVNLYFGIVTGFNPAGTGDPYGRNVTYAPGDVAIDPNLAGSTAAYGLMLPQTSTGSGSAGLVKGGTWNIPNAAQGFPSGDRVKYQTGGTMIAAQGAYYYSVIGGNNPLTYHDPVTNKAVAMYLIEGSIPLAAINKSVGDSVTLQWGASCSNDVMSVTHTVVPEPSGVGAVLTAFGMLASRLRRKK